MMTNKYVFIFTAHDGVEERKAIWADSVEQAWQAADNYAYYNGFYDFRLVEK